MSGRLPYIGGLDGLRALAVIAVLLFHAELYWSPVRFSGGFLGVDVFFVLSGYLITSLLLSERVRGGGIDVRGFWLRRARRLLPAVAALIIGVLVYAVLFLPEEVVSLRVDVLAALTYVTNWYLIVDGQSYFESWGRPSLLQHLWSLAIEEQFYLLWPLLFAGGVRLLRPQGLLVALLAGAAASAALMAFLYQSGADQSRIYYGTDTRAMGLLLGSALALVWTPAQAQASASTGRAWALDVAGLASLAMLVYFTVWLSDSSAFLYQGGFAAIAAGSVLVIAAVVQSGSRLGAVLGTQPLRWIGQRSYSIYLWHWPIYMVTRPGLDVSIDGWQLLAVRLGIVLALAEISYRLVETPIRRGALNRAWDALRARARVQPYSWAAAYTSVLGILAIGIVLLGVTVGSAPAAEEPPFIAALEQPFEPPAQFRVADGGALAPPRLVVAVGKIETPTPRPVVAITATPANLRATPLPDRDDCNQMRGTGYRSQSERQWFLSNCITPTPKPIVPVAVASLAGAPVSGVAVTAIGDSVMLGAAPQLYANIGGLDLYAAVSFQASAGVGLIGQLAASGALSDVVVVHLGNNGPFSASELDEMMASLAGVSRVIFLTVKVPRSWEGSVNAMLSANVGRYPNAVLADWRGASAGHPEYFWTDGLHLRPEGALAYASFILAWF